MDLKALEALIFSNNFLKVFFIIFLSPMMIMITLLLLKSSHKRGVKLPPGPYSWPIVGNLFNMNMDGKKPHISMANLAKSFGPLMSLKLGSRLIVFASTPEAAKQVYRIHDKELSGRFKPMFNFIIPQINNSTIALHDKCDEKWRFLRGMCYKELFSTEALESQSKLRLEKVTEMVDFLNTTTKDGQVVKIVDVIFATFANMISSIMVSHNVVESWEKVGEVKHIFDRLFETAIPGFSDLYPALAMLDHFSMKQKVTTYLEIAGLLWNHVISKRRNNIMLQNNRKRDFLDVLMTHSWDDVQICNLLTELLVSTESLTTLVEWTMVELLRNEEAFSKLRYEIEEDITKQGKGGNLMEGYLNNKLPYLQDCIKETIRLHPPAPFLVPRVALKTCKVMDYDIPKDCLIVTNAYALGRDPITWGEDALSFKPERFEGKNVDLKVGSNYGLLPFGGGRRLCLGIPLALNHIQLILALLVHTYDWSLPGDRDPATLDMSENFGVTLSKKHSLQLILKKRNHLNIS